MSPYLRLSFESSILADHQLRFWLEQQAAYYLTGFALATEQKSIQLAQEYLQNRGNYLFFGRKSQSVREI